MNTKINSKNIIKEYNVEPNAKVYKSYYPVLEEYVNIACTKYIELMYDSDLFEISNIGDTEFYYLIHEKYSLYSDKNITLYLAEMKNRSYKYLLEVAPKDIIKLFDLSNNINTTLSIFFIDEIKQFNEKIISVELNSKYIEKVKELITKSNL
jgi:hypothetical protein